MSEYLNSLDSNIRKYFSILSEDFPEFLEEYIETPAMKKQAGISVSCGTIYTKLFNYKYWYSSLDHSVAVALIIWHFTKDKKQTLSGLFHDIATPAFKHVIDFMNGDYTKQESTEELTTDMIANSKEIMELLKRDGIKLEEVCDYHIYPIADNDTPRLSSDRLEYTMSNGLGVRRSLFTLEEIAEIYSDICVLKNEEGIIELGFKTPELAEKFVHNMSILSMSYVDNPTKLTMHFLAETMRKMSNFGLITKKEMYELSEKEVIDRIEKCEKDNVSKYFEIWKNAISIIESETPIENKFGGELRGKLRYINPLVATDKGNFRLREISENARTDIDKCVNYTTPKYAYFDFNF